MDCLEEYIKNLSKLRKERFLLLNNYLKNNFPKISVTCEFSPKCNFPIWINNADNMYVAIANMKNYISVYFSKRECITFIAKENPSLKHGVSCINIKDNENFPIKIIQKAVNICFNN